MNKLAQHITAMATDSYLMGHPEWLELVKEARQEIEAMEPLHRFTVAPLEEPEFFWQDLSGRGDTDTLYLSSFVDFDDEVEDEEPPLSEWINEARIGEVWESHSDRYTRIK